MPELVHQGDRRLIVAGGFRLAFTWRDDRWFHALEYRGPGESADRVLAVSIEEDPDRDDPTRVVSPTYQQLEFQKNGEAMQALLVGQSGPHHFSAVFSLEEEFVQGVVGRNGTGPPFDVHLKVDIADRCRTPVHFLAGTYVVEARSGDLVEADSASVTWNFGSDHLNFLAERPAQVAFAEAGRRATQVQAVVKPEPGSSTHRLVYQWIWEGNLPD